MKKDTPKKQTLTDKQEGFAVSFVMNGGDATAAYRENYSYKNMKDNTLWMEAHKVKVNPKVADRIHTLRVQKISTKILTIEERKQLLSERALEGDNKALDILNKMEAVYIEKVQTDITIDKCYLPIKDESN